MSTGIVKWFSAEKGYGFIKQDDGNEDVFVHISAVESAGIDGLQEGQAITYEIEDNRGKQRACNLSW